MYVPATPFLSIDALVRTCAEKFHDATVISYPKAEEGVYIKLSATRLESLTRALAVALAGRLDAAIGTGLGTTLATSPRQGAEAIAVAMVGISNIEYYLTYLALQRLGVSTMLISPRLADAALAQLLRVTGCRAAVTSGASVEIVGRVLAEQPGMGEVRLVEMLAVDEILSLSDGELVPLDVDEKSSPLLMMHSSGSTGLPKPVSIRMGVFLTSPAWMGLLGEKDIPSPMVATTPLFHSYGHATMCNSLACGTHLALTRAERPMTVAGTCRVMDDVGCRKLATVPLLLKYFAETPGGPERLARLQEVQAGGAATPDDIGQILVDAGVRLAIGWGQTESGVFMKNDLESPDYRTDWNHMSLMESSKDSVTWEEAGTDSDGQTMYHFIIRPNVKTLVMHDRPDGSYSTKDLFRRHPTKSHLWHFCARKDDVMVMVNGEKADPLPLEMSLVRNPNVFAAVAFGAGRDALGMLVVRSDRAKDLSRDQFVASLLPELERGNAQVAAWTRVVPEGLLVLDAGTQLPMTDKSTVIRGQVMRRFANEIDAHYAAREAGGARDKTKILAAVTDPSEVKDVVRQAVGGALKRTLADHDDDADFFQMGMDSLQAVNVRAALLRRLGGIRLATNVAFDHPTIARLTAHVLAGGKDAKDSGINLNGTAAGEQDVLARRLLAKYSVFRDLGVEKEHGFVVLLTGATGGLGRHILATLLQHPRVRRVYCLVRAPSDAAAQKRVLDALADAVLDVAAEHVSKLTSLASTLSERILGLDPATYVTLRSTVTTIIHNAWSVNFNMSLDSFEPACIAGTHRLLSLALSSSRRPVFTFVSSIAAAAYAASRPVAETRQALAAAVPGGYGRSKWVAEELCFAAAADHGLCARIMRVGQVSGDTARGRWNPAEAVPTMVRSAVTVGALPVLRPNKNKQYWLPADVCGDAVVDAALMDRAAADQVAVFHVLNSQPVLWNEEVLPALAAKGLVFEKLSQEEWVKRLESEMDVAKNPVVKLLDHFRARFGGGIEAEGDGGDGGDGGDDGGLVFDMKKTVQYIPRLKGGVKVDEALVGRFYDYWKECGWTRGGGVLEKQQNGNGTAH